MTSGVSKDKDKEKSGAGVTHRGVSRGSRNSRFIKDILCLFVIHFHFIHFDITFSRKIIT